MDKIKQLKKALKKLLKHCEKEEFLLLDKTTGLTVNYDYFNNRYYPFKGIFSLELHGSGIIVRIAEGCSTFDFNEQDHIDYMLESIISIFIIAHKINSDDCLDILSPGVLIDN